MAVDITRFDFHAQKFVHSDNVRAMSLEEIGMYVLLLIESWLTAKEASLPDNMNVFKTISRGKDVSPLVLSMFPVVETQWGPRRQNPTLYGEWMEAMKRSDDGRKAVESRWEKQRNLQPSYDSNTGVFPALIPKPSQAVSSQANTSKESGSVSGQCSFKNISSHYASFMGVSHSHGKKHVERYQIACSKYGENKVLEYFDRWAATADWLRDKRDTNGLNLFWRPLDDLAAGDQLSKERESVRKMDETSSDVLLAEIKKSEAETIELEDAEWKKKFEEDQKFLAENRDKI